MAEKENIEKMEEHFIEYIPVVREHFPLDKVGGKVILALPQTRYHYLGYAVFEIILEDDRRLEAKSENEWMVFPGRQSTSNISLLVKLISIDETPFEMLTPDQRQTMFLGPALLVEFTKKSRFDASTL